VTLKSKIYNKKLKINNKDKRKPKRTINPSKRKKTKKNKRRTKNLRNKKNPNKDNLKKSKILIKSLNKMLKQLMRIPNKSKIDVK
jgi:hypothetical protein